jgi:hypothetical protein
MASEPRDVDDVTRERVLESICRGYTWTWTARRAELPVAAVKAIAEEAGWPDAAAAYATWRTLKLALGRPQKVRPKPAEPRHDLSVARIAPVRFVETHIGVIDTAWLSEKSGAEILAADELSGATVYMLTEEDEALIASEEVLMIPAEVSLAAPKPLPEPTDSPSEPAPELEVRAAAPTPVAKAKPKPRQVPCEVCGLGVLVAYVEANGGIQRHGHHPKDAT